VLRLPSEAAPALGAGSDGTSAVAWVEPGSPPGAGIGLFDGTGKLQWRTGLRGPGHRLAVLSDQTVVVAVGKDIVALRQGQVLWRRTVPDLAAGLAGTGTGQVLVALPNRLFCLGPGGATAWELAPRGRTVGLRAGPEGSWVVLIESDGAELFQLPEARGRDDT
ncbi:MAG: PQQ-binding-like beta-propeller repeat protein, partial [Firmicutes bacterium]|nr:PQQ-binding-like beta-propeller repeat protein [Bacillota bacterium]